MKKGSRKIVMGAFGVLAVCGGYVFSALMKGAEVGFPAFATAVVSIVGLIVAGNVGEHAMSAKAEGSKGIVAEDETP